MYASDVADLEKTKRLLDEFYARFPDMAPSPEGRRAMELRDEADKIERQEARRVDLNRKKQEAIKLRSCERMILQKIGGSHP